MILVRIYVINLLKLAKNINLLNKIILNQKDKTLKLSYIQNKLQDNYNAVFIKTQN